MIDASCHLARLVDLLMQHGETLLSEEHPLLQGQSDLDLFNNVSGRLQGILDEADFALNVVAQDSGFLITLKLGDEASEAPDFTPPEPRLL